ncbi:unnamed protein product, partial [Ectocarpus sp. 13 AM-2016]
MLSQTLNGAEKQNTNRRREYCSPLFLDTVNQGMGRRRVSYLPALPPASPPASVSLSPTFRDSPFSLCLAVFLSASIQCYLSLSLNSQRFSAYRRQVSQRAVASPPRGW